jgi:hypothetical protein
MPRRCNIRRALPYSPKQGFPSTITVQSGKAKGVKMRTGIAILALLAATSVFASESNPTLQERQADILQRGAEVMPFDLKETVHVFTKTRSGGIQQVLARNPADVGQIRLIRQHLRDIEQKFAKRDFSDPAAIHGEDMPGLAALRTAKPGQLSVRYRDIAGGAQLVYRASDPKLVKALHSWFNAQLSDHGSDAMEGHHHHPM